MRTEPGRPTLARLFKHVRVLSPWAVASILLLPLCAVGKDPAPRPAVVARTGLGDCEINAASSSTSATVPDNSKGVGKGACSILEARDQALELTPDQVSALIARSSSEDIDAECLLAVAYTRGIGVPHNDAEAIKWLTRAANHGITWAQNALAGIYRQGVGIPQDYSEAVKWYRTAAEEHYPAAADALGYMYLSGLGVSKDYASAAQWYSTAAEQDYAPAQNNLGQLYQHGCPQGLRHRCEPLSSSSATGPCVRTEQSRGNVRSWTGRWKELRRSREVVSRRSRAR